MWRCAPLIGTAATIYGLYDVFRASDVAGPNWRTSVESFPLLLQHLSCWSRRFWSQFCTDSETDVVMTAVQPNKRLERPGGSACADVAPSAGRSAARR
jgi:hypothetical protein